MPFKRPISFYEKRFHEKQFEAWLAYKAGLDLVLPWGRRSGKSEAICQIFVEDIEEYGKPCLFVAKTRDQARDIVWPKFEQILKGNPDWRLYESTLECVHKPSGAVIKIKGVDKDADNLAGSGYRLIACDEYALWRKPEVVKRVLVPMLGDYNGQIIFTSTKRGKNHFYELHQKALKMPHKYFVSEATMFDNTFMSDEGRAKVLSEYAGADDPLYRQEVLNEYIAFEGMAFALPEESYTERRWDPADLDHSIHWRGMDHGYSPDPTAAIWIAYNHRKGYFQIYSDYSENKLLIATHAELILAQEPYTISDTISDIDPQVMAEYENVGLSLTPAMKADKKGRILKMVNALRTGQLKIAHNCTKLLKEMASYQWDQDGNDHCIDAALYAWGSVQKPVKEIVKKKTLPDPMPPEYTNSYGQSFGSDEYSYNEVNY